MKSLSVKIADLKSAQSICGISRKTFTESYGDYNTPENMEKYLEDHFNPAVVIKELDNKNNIFLLAYCNRTLVGYAKVNVGSNPRNLKMKSGAELERIYVLRKFQKQGIGKILLRESERLALKSDCKTLWLGVWIKNLSAIRFYKREGFAKFGKHIFMLGEDKQIDLLLKISLSLKEKMQ